MENKNGESQIVQVHVFCGTPPQKKKNIILCKITILNEIFLMSQYLF